MATKGNILISPFNEYVEPLSLNISITNPAGGETYNTDDSVPVSWVHNDLDSEEASGFIEVLLDRLNEDTFPETVIASVDVDDLTDTFTATDGGNLSDSQVRIRLINLIDDSILDTSNYFTINLLDGLPPGVENESPTNGSNDVDVDSEFSFDIVDVSDTSGISGVDPASVVIQLNGNIIFQNELPEAGYSVVVTPITNGFHYEIQPDGPLEDNEEFEIEVDAADNSGNIMSTFSYSFNTGVELVGPYICGIYPQDGSLDTPTNSTIAVDICSYSAPINLSTVLINVSINGESFTNVFDGSKFNGVYGGHVSGWRGQLSRVVRNKGNGFRIIMDKESGHLSNSSIELQVFASDFLGNSYSWTYVIK